MVACVLPAWLTAAALISASYFRDRAALAESNVITARALSQVIDRELVRTEASLQALATSPSLAAGDLAAFDRQVTDARRSSGADVLALLDPSGQQVINTLMPFGVPLPRRSDITSLQKAIATGAPAVSNLVLGGIPNEYLVTVDVPVFQNGKATRVLEGSLTAKHFLALLQRRRQPAEWMVGLIDTDGTVIARTNADTSMVGRQVPASLRIAARDGDDGALVRQTLDGKTVLTAFSRSPISGWTLTISVPLAAIHADLQRFLWLSIAGAGALLLLAIVASQAVSAPISRSIRALCGPARAMASGAPFAMPPVAISEVREVGDALAATAGLLAEGAKDRARADASERRAMASERFGARLFAFMEAAPYAMVVVNRAGQIRFVNGKVKTVFGYERDELLGREVDILLASETRAALPAARDRFFADLQPREMGSGLEFFCQRRDGTLFPVDISLSPLEIDGESCVMAAVHDITAQKQLEAEIEANRARAAASARLSALGTMAGGIAHEINNPLAAIRALAEDLGDDATRRVPTSSEVVDATEQITRMADRIATIIRSLRHLARDGQNDPLVDTALRDVVAAAVDLGRQVFDNAAVTLTVPPIDPDIRIRCREVEISQILFNLLQNGFDAVRPEPGRQWVRLEVEVRGRNITISVIDSGPGVPEGLEDRIMEPFFTTKPVGQGTGLGLSLSRQIAELHGGSLEFSRAGGHTCFMLTLPLA